MADENEMAELRRQIAELERRHTESEVALRVEAKRLAEIEAYNATLRAQLRIYNEWKKSVDEAYRPDMEVGTDQLSAHTEEPAEEAKNDDGGVDETDN